MANADFTYIDKNGFFTQDEWEYALDLISPSDFVAITEHMKSAPAGHPTASWLSSFMGSSPKAARSLSRVSQSPKS